MKTIKKTPRQEMEGVIEQAFRECSYCLEGSGGPVDCLKCRHSVQAQLIRLLVSKSRTDELLVV
jgi:hypothetical protein